MINDLRHAWRSLLARPMFNLVIVLTLAVGIGANSAIFGALQAVLFNPLPFHDPERVVLLGEYTSTLDTQFVSPITYDDWKTRAEAFEELAAFRYWQTVNLEDTSTDPEAIDLVTASANFFSALGVKPLIGRTFNEEQNKNGGSEAVISYELWKRRYHGDPAVLGRAIRVRGTAPTIVGVMPPASLTLALGWGDVWTCLYRYNLQQQRATSYRARYLTVVGRLKPGVSFDQALTRMTMLQHQLWREPASVPAGYDVRLRPVRDALTAHVRVWLLAVSAAVGMVLLIACANVANLMLVRAAVRQRDTAVRFALGARPLHMVRLLLAESLCLVALGAGGGLALAYASLIALRRFRADIPRVEEAALTPRVLAFTMAISLTSAVLFSLVPLLQVRRRDLRNSLTEGGRGGSDGIRARRIRKVLVAGQMALACALLVCGGLLFRSLQSLLRVNPGFQPQQAVVFDVYLPNSRYPDAAAQTRFYRDLLRSLGEAPRVESAGGLLYFPYKPKLWLSALWVEDRPVVEGEEPVVYFNLVAGDYFQAMGIPLVAGRLPDAREMWEAPRVAVINESLARLAFPGRSPLGRRIRTDKDEPWLEVVGIVGDVRQKRLDEPPKPEIYTTFASMPMPFLSIVARTSGGPDRMLNVIRGVVRDRDAGLAVANLTPLGEYVAQHTAERRFALVMLGVFAVLAVGLGALGVYGVMSYSVAQRRREIAIRLALGASPSGVRAMVVRDGLIVVLAGTAAGLVAAAVAARLARGLLFGVGAFDLPTFVAVPAVLLSIAGFAAWLPARRASGIDPVTALTDA